MTTRSHEPAAGSGTPAPAPGPAARRQLPPGQRVTPAWPVVHYGPVPPFRPVAWDFTVAGATADGTSQRWTWPEFGRLPRTTVVADLHCVTRFSVLDNTWAGVSAGTLLALRPPAPGVRHVMVWAEYGYGANVRLSDLAQASAVFVTHRNGEPLAPEHGSPLRLVVPHLYAWKGPKWVRGMEYLTRDRRGFWEQRGYHNRAEAWREQRWGYQEEAADGPSA